jgi:hypothetical protein
MMPTGPTAPPGPLRQGEGESSRKPPSLAEGSWRRGRPKSMRRVCVLLFALLGLWLPAQAAPPARRVAALARGINITNWLRFPA